MKTYKIDDEKLAKIVRTAFGAGEQWGNTYSSWFTPTKEENEKKIREATTKAKRIVRRKK